jgi:2-polyprenyl-3-methyl-5-hydroxy-6-metoxy-1,4-benzoquinol methylase
MIAVPRASSDPAKRDHAQQRPSWVTRYAVASCLESRFARGCHKLLMTPIGLQQPPTIERRTYSDTFTSQLLDTGVPVTTGVPTMNDPCAFSPSSRQARKTARFYAAMFAPRSTVVDIGFGQGFFLEEARAMGLRAIGIDRDAKLVESALSRGLEAHQADVRDVASQISTPIGGVMAAHIIEHLPPEDVCTLIADIAGLVSPGGIAVFATPNPGDWRVISDRFWTDPTHIRPYTAGTVRELTDPTRWRWDADGFVPVVITRETPKVVLKRLLYGPQYGRSSRWYRIQRSSEI